MGGNTLGPKALGKLLAQSGNAVGDALALAPIYVPASIAIPTLNLLILALSTAGGGTIGVRAGQGNIDQSIQMKSNVTLYFETGARFTNTGLANDAPAFVFGGSTAAGVPLAVNLTTDSTDVTTTTAHGLSVGDIVQVVSQRNAVAATAPVGASAASIASRDAWRLGNGTPNSQFCYFGEFGIVKSVHPTDTTKFSLTSGLVFPDYRTDATAEATGSTNRGATTIRRITTVRNARVVGGRFDLTAANAQFFKGTYAYKCSVEDVVVDQKTYMGSIAMWRQSFCCELRRCTALQDLNFDIPDTDIGKYNHFKVTSGHNCNLIDCRSFGGSQCFDYTYFNEETCNLNCRVERFKSFYARANAGTTHPGGYGIDIIDGEFLHCLSNGLSIRTRAGRIAGNRITGSGKSGSYGLALGEAWARGSLVSTNHAEGFDSLYYVYDGGEADERWGRIDCQFIGNTGRRGYYGFNRFASALNANTLPSGLILRGFTFELIQKSYINIGKYTPTVTVEGGHFHGPLTDSGVKVGVYMTGEATDHTIAHNHFYDGGSGETAISIAGITDTTAYPSGDAANLNVVEPNFYHSWAGARFGSPPSRIRPNRPTAVPGTAIIAAGGLSVTVTAGSTAEEALATFTVPANWMGLNGILEVEITGNHTNSANTKSYKLRAGSVSGTILGQFDVTTSATLVYRFVRQARSDTASQTGPALNSPTFGATTQNPVVLSTLDMTQDQVFVITGQKATGSETQTLTRWFARVSNPVG